MRRDRVGAAVYPPCVEQTGATLEAALRAVTAAALIAASITDLRTRRIPDAITAPSLAIVLALSFIGDASDVTSSRGALLGAASFGLPLAAISLVRPGAMGMGDAKLAALIGAAVGALDLSLLPATVVAGFAAGALVAASTWVLRRDRSATIAFGPSLALPAVVAMLIA